MLNEKGSISATMVVVSLGWKGDTIATGTAAEGGVVTLGEDDGSIAPLSADVLGAASLAVADAMGGAHVRVPEGKVASIRSANGQMRLVVGPAREALLADDEASILFGAFDVVVTGLARTKETGRRRMAMGAWTHTAIVAAVHAALLFAGSRAALAAQMQDEGPDPNVDAMRAYLASAEERSAAQEAVMFGVGGSKDPTQKANGQNGNGKDGGGERHEGDAGKAGSRESRGNKGHWGATAKPSESTGTPDVDDVASARNFGLISVLTAANADAGSRGVGVHRASDDSPWGASDPFAAVGSMLGQSVGETEGTGGLALSGIGEGGGGTGDGIGLGTIGTIGHTNGFAGIGTGGSGMTPNGLGFGGGWGHWHASAPRVRVRGSHWGEGWGVSGRLPPEAIQRIVRQNFGRFRLCYEDGLRRNPSLEGRVTVNFVIGRDGAVSNVSEGGSDLPDQQVRSCVVRNFYGLSFPQPEGGIVTVAYPISFSSLGAPQPTKKMSFTPGE